ncbi:MAG: hypothetical protein L0227_06880 [Chloroflexi bacterium]|nr:hypothetical protein [Chloroflexota bacterium]
MRAPKFRLGTWLDRLGVPAIGGAPDVAETIVPVMLVADYRGYSTPERLQVGYFQAIVDPDLELVGPPARYAGCQVLVRSPGGARVIVSVNQAVGDSAPRDASFMFPYASFIFTDTTLANVTVVSGCIASRPDPLAGDGRMYSIVNATRSTAGTPVIVSKNTKAILFGGASWVQPVGPPVAVGNDYSTPNTLDCYMPPGRELYLEAYGANYDLVFNVQIVEYPEP